MLYLLVVLGVSTSARAEGSQQSNISPSIADERSVIPHTQIDSTDF
jgi:hypothetical protein